MNFIEQFNEGLAGNNIGLSMGAGLKPLSNTLGGVQKKKKYAVAAGPKVGKSTLTDYAFVIEPYFDSLLKDIPFEVIYFSFEIDRISKEFDFAAHFLYRDFNLDVANLPGGVTYKNKTTVPISGDYLMGQVQDDLGNSIMVSLAIYEKLILVYQTRIIPLFGEYDASGIQISKGIITFIENKENPTGIRNKLLEHAALNGQFFWSTTVGSGGKQYTYRDRYKPNNNQKITLVVMDHVRKLLSESGFKMKETIDKYSEYTTEIRNMCSYSFVDVIHLNRSITDVTRLQFAKERLYPTSEDIKDTGNLAEECNYVLTMFNPNDDKYHLSKHFDRIIRNPNQQLLFPYLRTIHLVESRHCEYPQHFAVNMRGNLKTFEQLN
jgi:hypothetical protein